MIVGFSNEKTPFFYDVLVAFIDFKSEEFMIPELGYYALILSFCFAVIQVFLPVFGNVFRLNVCFQLSRSIAYAHFFAILISFLVLSYSFLVHDFSVAYVANNSSVQLPAIYRFCAVWGAHEGSLLLWTFLLAAWVAVFALLSSRVPIHLVAQILGVTGFISAGFSLFLITVSNPLIRLFEAAPQNGQDLNPLLQDIGLILHPPMLYMGYVGFAIAFAFGMVALWNGRFDADWVRWSKPWTLAAWCFLTLGIVLGSWWAYRELGWGGWWFWDPVENASLLPWLAGTALIHSLIVSEKRNAFKAWTILLAILAFSLSLFGTFLVRSGVLISVHSFAVDPARGIFMLVLLLTITGSSLLLYAIRASKIRSLTIFGGWSRENLLLLNNLFLLGSIATILLGTLYPMIMDVLKFEKISVGTPYFNTVFLPFAAGILLLMGLVPVVRWGNTPFYFIVQQRWAIFLFAVCLAIGVVWLHHDSINFKIILGLSLAFWVMFSTLKSIFNINGWQLTFRKLSLSRWGMIIAHLGVAVCAIGVVMVSHGSIQKELRLLPGDRVLLAGYEFYFSGLKEIKGENYLGVQAQVFVTQEKHPIAVLTPEQRSYYVRNNTTLSDTAIAANFWRDLYVALGEPLGGDAWSFRIYYKPFVRWIWAGGALMALGGLLALIRQRRI